MRHQRPGSRLASLMAIPMFQYQAVSPRNGLWQEGQALTFKQGGLRTSSDSAPSYFVEYWNGCGNYCRFTYGTINSNVHEYKIQRSSIYWCGYIDGTQKDCASTSTLGFTTTSDEQYFGETTDTSIQLGGTGTSHFRMTDLSFQDGSGWFQVNTNSLSIYVSPGTSYHASAGFTYPDTWEDNWTQ